MNDFCRKKKKKLNHKANILREVTLAINDLRAIFPRICVNISFTAMTATSRGFAEKSAPNFCHSSHTQLVDFPVYIYSSSEKNLSSLTYILNNLILYL